MKLKYLGTAAAEGWPAVFCNCSHCQKAREEGGKNLRSRSQAILDDDALIDFPMDTYHHALSNSLNLSAVKYVFITHTHEDHFFPDDLAYRGGCFGNSFVSEKIEFIGNEEMINILQNKYLSRMDRSIADRIIATYLPLHIPTTFGDYKVTALHADHKHDEIAYVYIIEKDGKTLLYLHDTGILPEESFEYLKQNKIKADLVSYDCTFVLADNSSGHLGLPNVVTLRDRFAADGIIAENTVNIINHFSHNCGVPHNVLVEEAAKYGFVVAYDGMEIEV